MRRRSQRGNMALETALFMPVLLLLLVGMVQVGKITYLYHTLKKIVYSAARELSVQQGVNFCDLGSDANAQAAIRFAITDSTGALLIPNLTADMLSITTECSAPGAPGAPPVPCDTSACPVIGQRPDYVVVTIPNGYLVTPRIPFLNLDPIPLRPSATVPFGGIS